MAPRRDLDEWLTAVKVGRNVRYAVLEGPSDRAIVASLVSASRNADVTDVTTLQVDLDIPETVFLGGNRARLARLSEHLRDRGLQNGVCVVDRDFEGLHPSLPLNQNLQITDFANMPVGFCDREFVAGFFLRGYNIEIGDGDWLGFADIFRKLFAFRFWRASNAPNEEMPDAANYLSCQGNTPQLDWEAFFSRVQAASEGRLHAAASHDETDQIVATLQGDCRMFIHSDDFFGLIFMYLRLKRKVANTLRREDIRAALLSGMAAPRAGQDQLIGLVHWLAN